MKGSKHKRLAEKFLKKSNKAKWPMDRNLYYQKYCYHYNKYMEREV